MCISYCNYLSHEYYAFVVSCKILDGKIVTIYLKPVPCIFNGSGPSPISVSIILLLLHNFAV
jgi:hypothetical protein